MDRQAQDFAGFDPQPSQADRRGIDPLVAVKLWDNPCWLSFRINYLALGFNNPVYGLIEAHYGLKRPDFVVLYSLALKDGVAARDISLSSGFPKNSISRSVQDLLKRGLIRRAADKTDRRSFRLWLMPAGQTIVAQVTPAMVERERAMLVSLTPAERHMLFDLLGKMVIRARDWPATLTLPHLEPVPEPALEKEQTA